MLGSQLLVISDLSIKILKGEKKILKGEISCKEFRFYSFIQSSQALFTLMNLI